MAELSATSKAARAVAAAVEPFAGQVYFSPECHQNYEKLGFPASPGDMAGVALPEMASCFTRRGSVMGQGDPGRPARRGVAHGRHAALKGYPATGPIDLAEAIRGNR